MPGQNGTHGLHVLKLVEKEHKLERDHALNQNLRTEEHIVSEQIRPRKAARLRSVLVRNRIFKFR